jgi:hypothetical protein
MSSTNACVDKPDFEQCKVALVSAVVLSAIYMSVEGEELWSLRATEGSSLDVSRRSSHQGVHIELQC